MRTAPKKPSLLIEEAHVAVSKTHLAGLNTLSHRNNWSHSNISSQSELKRWTSGFDILPPKKEKLIVNWRYFRRFTPKYPHGQLCHYCDYLFTALKEHPLSVSPSVMTVLTILSLLCKCVMMALWVDRMRWWHDLERSPTSKNIRLDWFIYSNK